MNIKDEIIKAYTEEKIGIDKISKRLGIGRHVIAKTLKESNIEMRTKEFGSPKYKYDEKTIEYMIESYKNGKGLYAISREFNVCYDVILRIFRENGNIKIRGFREQQQLDRKHKFNYSYFDKIDTHEKAYFLGLLYSDGYNNTKLGRIYISLKKEDGYILENFKTELGLESKKLYEYNYKTTFGIGTSLSLPINCKKMSESLNKLGCVKAKSKILKFPTKKQLPEKFLNSFILGYFDGDGSVYENIDRNQDRDKKCSVTILSSLDFINSLKDILAEKIDINSWIREGTGCYRLEFSNKNSLKFYNFIYKDSKFNLIRKKKRFEKYIDYRKKNFTPPPIL